MKTLLKAMKGYFNDESGQTSTEYILLIAVVAALIMRLRGGMQDGLQGVIDNVFQGKVQEILNEM